MEPNTYALGPGQKRAFAPVLVAGDRHLDTRLDEYSGARAAEKGSSRELEFFRTTVYSRTRVLTYAYPAILRAAGRRVR
jgi:hypothetical protein